MLTARSNQFISKVPAWPIYIVMAIPGLVYFYWAVTNQLGADPLKALEHQLGVWALQLLIAGLAITPIREVLNINLIKYRRAIGLMAFFYTAAHLLTYLWLDQQWWWSAIWKDITKRPYIILGVLAFLSMVPLAITSNNQMIRKMGPIKWRKLHRLVYLTAIGGVLHYLLLTKTWQLEPMIYALILMGLLGHRVVKLRKAHRINA